MDLKKHILNVKDFPIDGIDFKDVTPLLNDADAFAYVIDEMAKFVIECGANVVVAPEARGFLFASAVAYKSHTRFVLVRKPGKLPREVIDIEYTLEYGTNHQQMHKGDIKPGDKVVIIDDVLATGGTIEAIVKLVEMQEGKVEGVSFLIDLPALHDENLLQEYKVQKLVKY
ncbi:adenine phosphoribosyltransferase [Mesoplasma florum L1]|uniref:Adenine phosphoribosyltransferase n=2 Tax=Mesoplasma florum TaxID=2151 RepID=APT_MESFL|nr:adenine phosphoribosyltransferase [Mesoplasma florum]Q6F1J0.1 RecName: Full=Adenine phosphoribosyltransferase; Short=APRT [Mesoplasma florum L1]AAT75633.1 adenine phosphoribosyltransferase [Mesoplasma florum L1]AGY41351.1 Adenine phosphoribosyltransferase [Mesoplasma florum W37]ATI73921.1 adenine phosphoribosyltransferase [Mesoplasma florum]AVN58886.1 adenine phosphoribosyltransferase [Mesoplasma florum]AVN59576.1 adenine phosphoribosyltransferase [Mesoplasma florum]